MNFQVPPWIASNANLDGHFADISVIPYYAGHNPNRQYNWYIIKYHETIAEHGPSFLIIEYSDKNGEFEWTIVPNSPIQGRPDLLLAASKYIDDYYKDDKNWGG